ncbi:Ig-like domain-containing protein [Brevibacillus fortis]|uniref:Ig-like domain-containing protein n=1 Tax=Brevibacillus fortis TaxID=2126352 RepID=UPI0038FCCBAA
MNKKVALSVLSTAVVASMAASAFAAPLEGVYVGGNVKKYYHTDTLFEMTKEARAQYKAHLKAVGEDNIVFVDHKGKGASIQEIFDEGKAKALEEKLVKEDFADLYQVVKPDGTTSGTENAKDKVDPATGELQVESVSAINKTTIEVKFTAAVDAVEVSNITLSKGKVDTVKLSDDKKTATVGFQGLNYGESVTVKVAGVKAGDKVVPEKSETIKVPLINEIYELAINSDDADNVILADGATKTMLTATLKEKKTGNVADVDGVVKFSATKGGIAQTEVTLENGKASVQLTSAASDTSIVSFITVTVVDAPAAKEYEGLTGQFQVTFSPDPGSENPLKFVTAVKAESNQADRFFVTFSDKISAVDYKKVVTDPKYNGQKFGINVDGYEVAVKDVIQKSDKVLEFILDTDNLGSKKPTSNKISRAITGDLTAPNYLQDNETHILTFPANVGELVLANTGIQFIVTDAKRPFIYGVESQDQLEFKVKFSESMAEDLAEGVDGQVNDKFLLDGKKVRLHEGTATAAQVADAKAKNEVIVTKLEVGSYNALTGQDTRNYVNFKLHPDFKLGAGNHQIQIANVGDWAALVDSNNLVTTQTFDFNVKVDDGKPVPSIEVQSPEQWLISFNTTVTSIEDKTVEDAFKLYKADELATPLVYGEDYVITPVNEEGKAIGATIQAGEVVPYADKYLVEFTKDWTVYYGTDSTKDNYFTSTKNPYKVVVNNLRNGLYNQMNETPLSVTLNLDGVSPTIASAVDVGTLENKTANGHVVTDNGQAVFVKMSEPVQITQNGNTLPLTPSQKQLNGTGIPQPTFEFVKGDKVVLGKVKDGTVWEDDKDFVVVPETTLEGGTWTLYIRSISDDVGNTSATVNTQVTVPATTTITDTKVAWSAFDNDGDKDYLYIKFTKEMDPSGAAGVSRTTNYIFNAVALPDGSQVVRGIKNVTNNWDGVTIEMPKGGFDGANRGEVDFRSVLNVANNFKAADGEVLSGPYEVQLEDTNHDAPFTDNDMVFEAVYYNKDASAALNDAAVLGATAFDEDADGKIDAVELKLDKAVDFAGTDEVKVNGKTFKYASGTGTTLVKFTAISDSNEVPGTDATKLQVTAFNGGIIINDGLVVDKAIPVVTALKGAAGSKNVTLTFSETIKSTTGDGKLTKDDFEYVEATVAGGTTNGPIASVATNKGKVSSLVVTLTNELNATDAKNDFAKLLNTVVDLADNAATGTPTPANNAPTVANPILDKAGTAGGAVVTVDASNTFADADADTLTLAATSSNAAIATVTVNGNNIEVTPVAAGTATITVTANDGKGGTVTETFDFVVNPAAPANNAPTVANAIQDTTGTVGTDVTVNASGTFADTDGDTLTLTAASSDSAIATVAVNGTDVVVTPVAAGTATITVTANDGKGGTVTETFDFVVNPAAPVNNAPTVANAIQDTTGTVGTDVTVNASGTFADTDGDTLTLTAASSDSAIATVAVNGTDVVVTPVAAGTATITVTANDGKGGTITETFDITIS